MSATPPRYQAQLLRDYFLANSLWRLELTRSDSDANFLAVRVHLLHSLVVANESRRAPSWPPHTPTLTLKIRVLLLDGELSEVCARHTLQAEFDVRTFLASVLSPSGRAHNHAESPKSGVRPLQTRLVERFTIDKFCRSTELLAWLQHRHSGDFCLLGDFKVYEQVDASDSNASATLNVCGTSPDPSPSPASLSSSSCDYSGSSSASPSPPPPDHPADSLPRPRLNSVLVLSHKLAWTVKNWRHFLMSGSSHTFTNNPDRFSRPNTTLDHSTDPLQLGKLKSKLFKLTSNPEETCHEESRRKATSNAPDQIETLLNDVKWKLQLYPSGYSQEYEGAMSLFVNFNQLTGDLANFSQPTTRRKSHRSLMDLKANNSKVIEEKFYDQDPDTGLILLVKSPGGSGGGATLDKTVAESIDAGDFRVLDSLEQQEANDSVGKGCRRELGHLRETFVKASFQISILDHNGRKVDKCQSEKQHFELYGSWGYKEYMLAKDLVSDKEKYLTDDFSTLNLHCKIILYYTVTVRTNASYEIPVVFSDAVGVGLANERQLVTISVDGETKSEERIIRDLGEMGTQASFKSRKQAKINGISSQKRLKTPTKECNTLLYDLRRVLKQSDMYDLVIRAPINLECEEFIDYSNKDTYKEFKVHKLILSIRSEVFAKMFSTFTTHPEQPNRNESSLDIVDFDALTVETFLTYLYTDTLELELKKLTCRSSSNVSDEPVSDLCTHLLVELLKIADKYGVPRLKEACERQLVRRVSVAATVELLMVADRHGAARLKRRCFGAVSANLAEIVAQPAWRRLEEGCPVLLAEVWRLLYLERNGQ